MPCASKNGIARLKPSRYVHERHETRKPTKDTKQKRFLFRVFREFLVFVCFVAAFLFVPQRLNGIELRGLARRVDGGDEADEHGGADDEREIDRQDARS